MTNEPNDKDKTEGQTQADFVNEENAKTEAAKKDKPVRITNYKEHIAQFPKDYKSERVLKHLGGIKYKLTEHDEVKLIEMEKILFKSDLMEAHEQLVQQEIGGMELLKKQVKFLKENDFEITDELKAFKETLEKVLNIQKVEKARLEVKSIKNDLGLFRNQKLEIERAIPELKRNPKK